MNVSGVKVSIGVRSVRARGVLVLACLVMAVVLSTGSVLAERPPTSAPGTGRIQSGLVERARSLGSVRVVVNLRSTVPTNGFRGRAARSSFARTLRTHATGLAKVARSTGGRLVRRFTYLPSVVMVATPRTIERLRARPDVASVTRDRLYQPELNWNVPLVQGNLMNSAGYGGAGQIVAVLDTGVDATHPMLAGKVLTSAAACFASGASGIIGGPDTAGDCPDGRQSQTGPGAAVPCTWVPEDCRHGTHVAGIAVGRYVAHGPGGKPIAGVARDARVLPVQVFSEFDDPTDGRSIGAWDSDMAAGLEYVYQYATSHPDKHIAAVNMSIGGGEAYGVCDLEPDEQGIRNAADLLRSVGIATVIAAGNESLTGGTSYPACLSTAISVSATTRADVFSWFSDIAPWVDLAAPGSGIMSSVPGGYARLDGTSMAAPHVAGAWADIRSRFPNASFRAVREALRSSGITVRDAWSGIATRRIKVLDAGAWLGGTSTTLARSSPSVRSGATTSFTVRVTRLHPNGSDPTGRVVLRVGGVKVASVPIDPGMGSGDTAVMTITAKVKGKHGARVAVQASYKGDGRFVGSTSPMVTVTIR